MQIGIEVLMANPSLAKSWGRCALLCNQASLDEDMQSSWQLMHHLLGPRLTCLFGPQHGFDAVVQDNMIETGHGYHPGLGIPIHSLYSETREPSEKMLSDVDTIVIDIQIVGCRVYTFKYTIAACLRAAKKFSKKVVVLDRPNPLGGVVVEGNVLEPQWRSFVGEFEIPMRHGLTPAEAARLFNQEIGAQLETVSLEGWEPHKLWPELGRPWILTSPNLPHYDGVLVYPGGVLLEGTNLSEGRGTGLPFQFMGAPYLDGYEAIAQQLQQAYPKYQKDILFRPAVFQPTSQKWAGQACRGLHIVLRQPLGCRDYPFYTMGLSFLSACISRAADAFDWSQPPYEYDYENLPIKLICGSEWLVEQLERGVSAVELAQQWQPGLLAYVERVKQIALYERDFIAI